MHKLDEVIILNNQKIGLNIDFIRIDSTEFINLIILFEWIRGKSLIKKKEGIKTNNESFTLSYMYNIWDLLSRESCWKG